VVADFAAPQNLWHRGLAGGVVEPLNKNAGGAAKVPHVPFCRGAKKPAKLMLFDQWLSN
jgi:hypothetical protein